MTIGLIINIGLAAEYHPPNLLEDITRIIYTSLTGKEIRLRLKTQFGYNNTELLNVRTLPTKLNYLGYTLRISLDAKASVKIGVFSRGGYNRPVKTSFFTSSIN